MNTAEIEMMRKQVVAKGRFDLSQNMAIIITPPSMGHKGRVEVRSDNATTRHIGFLDDPKEIKRLIGHLTKLI